MPSFLLEKNGSDIVLHNKYGQYSKIELESQLKEGKLTTEELGKIYSLNKSQIIHVLRLLKISYRNRLSETRVPDFVITPSMHQIIIGTLLGDAYMKVSRSYMLSHSVNQMDYLYTVAEKFDRAVSAVQYKETKLGKSLNLWTNCHEVFESYYDRFYSRGVHKKYFCNETVKDLEPEGLAYWYMDDGKFDEYGMYLCTGNIMEEEAAILKVLLESKFGLKVTIQNHDIDKGYRYLYVKAESRDLFLSLIDPYVVLSMQYKLTGKPYPLLATKDLIAHRHLEFCKKVGKSVRFYGDYDIKRVIDKEQVISSEKEEYVKQQVLKKGLLSCTQIRKEPSTAVMLILFQQGLTDQEIANRYGYGRNRISVIRRSLGIPRKSVRVSPNNKFVRTVHVLIQ